MSEKADELTKFEQMIDGVAQLSAIVRAYYESLIENGFTKKEAMELTLEYQKSIIDLGRPAKQ